VPFAAFPSVRGLFHRFAAACFFLLLAGFVLGRAPLQLLLPSAKVAGGWHWHLASVFRSRPLQLESATG
jgi:hypothetical protein